MMFPKFWTQSDIDWSVKLDDSGSYDVRSETEWLVYCIVLSIGFDSKHPKSLFPPYYDVPQSYPLDFTQNTPNDSSHPITMFPKFWTQSDIDWSVKLDDSGSYDVHSEMEWLFYPLDFTQNTPNDSSHNIMMFPKFWTQSDIDWSVKLDYSGSYDVRSEMEWLVDCMFWTQSDIDWSLKLEDYGSYDVRSDMECLVRTMFVLKWSGWCIALFYPLDFTQNTPNDSSHHIMMFPKFWTQSDIDWSVKLEDSGSYDVRSEMECFGLNPISIGPRNWTIQFYRLDFTQNTPNGSSHRIMMFPKFWTQSDIDWSVKLDDSGSYDVRSEMERFGLNPISIGP
ncbi:unnamed protein product [Prunus armeniaca]